MTNEKNILIFIGLIVIAGTIGVLSFEAESAIPPTPAFSNIQINGTWNNATIYNDSLIIDSVGDGWVIVEKTTTETINNDAVLTCDSDLQFDVDANKTYLIQIMLFMTSDAAADFQSSATHPASGSLGFKSTTYWNSHAITSVKQWISAQANPTNGVNALSYQFYNGFLYMGTSSGTFCLTWAQLIATVADTKLWEGSYIMYRDLG